MFQIKQRGATIIEIIIVIATIIVAILSIAVTGLIIWLLVLACLWIHGQLFGSLIPPMLV